MKAFTFAAVAALAATSYAATVTLQETKCLVANLTLVSHEVEVDKLTVVDIPSICGLEIVSANDIDIDAIKCRAYQDNEGAVKGSAEFTSKKPALISNNPIQIGSILCLSSGDVPTAATTFAKITATAAAATGSTAAPSGGASPTGGNGTSPNSPNSPTPSPTGSPEDEGSASTLSMSFGALAGAAIAMLFL